MGEHILVPTDGSEQAAAAFEYALTLPHDEITLITVINPFDVDPEKPGYQSPLGKAGMPAFSGEWYENVREEARESHEELRGRADDPDAVSSVVGFGQPSRGILRYVEEGDVDHVVIASRGKRDLSKLLLGDVAETVVRRSPVPVTVVR
ncbi:universal stress protein [Halomarina halobia]|uniref:Universal stress protein n=1 Tax=Halomarina halobia TaxID=3033386 RepID=A0ABD6A6V6_9EURY|nr:universal stress protein [Halomarina sp. PSR21]